MIGTLTNDMIRLCGEIATLHEGRGELRSKLERGRKDLQETVSLMQADFRNAHGEMASKTKAELSGCLANLKDAVASVSQKVAALRGEILEDVAGAHRAWCGNVTGQAGFRPAAEKSAKGSAPKARKKKH